jgi:hypothetical protein
MEICPKLEDENFGKKFSAETGFCRIDPWIVGSSDSDPSAFRMRKTPAPPDGRKNKFQIDFCLRKNQS